MNKKSNSQLIVTAVIAVALISYAACILIAMCHDVLITAQDRNMFGGDYVYFSNTIARPFGLFQYIGGFLTQFFYYPALGAGMLIALWTASVFVGIKAFQLKGIWRWLMIVPAACLLTSEVDLGYWIYSLNIPGYWFSQSVAYLCILLLLWAARATPHRLRIIWYVVVGFLSFPFTGWYSYLFTACLALLQFTEDGEKHTHPSWIDGIGILITAAAPFVFYHLIYECVNHAEVLEAGFPFFKTSSDESFRQTMPFFVLIAFTLLCASLGMVSKELSPSKRISRIMVGVFPAALALLSAYYVWASVFKDDNYIYEMQMTQAITNEDWQKVISVAEKTKHPSRTMVMLKNIALMNTGELGERSFELGNSGVDIYNPDSLSINIMHIASPAIYYNYGKMNYAMRWCMESVVPYGFSPFYLKHLVRCAECTGEKALAKRYSDRLHQLLFYKDWTPAKPTAIVKELYTSFSDALDADDNNIERFIMHTFAWPYKKKSPLITELSLFYSMIIRNPELFCTIFYDYAKGYDGEYVPTSYEEAYYLFVAEFPDKIPYRINVRQSTIDNYKNFTNDGNLFANYASSEEVLGQQMFDSWNGTYWWFNAFGRKRY